MNRIWLVVVWLVGELRLVDFALKRADHWIGATALILAIIGLSAL